MNSATTMLAAESASGTNYLPLLLMVGLFVLTYFMFIRPQSKRRRAMVEMQASLEAGTKVITIGGLHATVAGTGDETVNLEIAPGVTATYARGAIAKIVPPTPAVSDEDASADSDTESAASVEAAPVEADVIAEVEADDKGKAADKVSAEKATASAEKKS